MAYVRARLDYIGPKGFLAEWRARRSAHASCKGVTYWDTSKGWFRTKYRHKQIVWIDEETTTCYCGQVSGQYVASRDAGTMLFKRESWIEMTETEAAEATRREWEDEYARQVGGGRWEWTTTDDEPGVVLPNGDVLASRKRVFVGTGDRRCTCGHAGSQHESDRAVGWGRCMFVAVGRTNDQMDAITAKCDCQRYDAVPPSKFMTTDTAEMSRVVRPADWNEPTRAESDRNMEDWTPEIGARFEQSGGVNRWVFTDGAVIEMSDIEVRRVSSYDKLKAKVLELKAARRGEEIKDGLVRRAKRDEGLV